MKTKNYFLLLLISMMSIAQYTQSQNPVWSTPPYYVKDNLPHNLPTVSPFYNNASNMHLDANGDILFYIIDDDIFDKDGDFIGNLMNFYDATHFLPYICMDISNTSEIVIVPDPANCSRFYIITSATTAIACNDEYVSPFLNHADPFVAILDFNVPRSGNPLKYGAITSVELLKDVSSMPQFGYDWLGTDMTGGILFTASKLKDNSGNKYRYLFVSSYTNSLDNGILRYKISSNGIEYDGFIPFEVQNADGGSRAEMELIELPNGQFRIACPYGSFNSTHNGKNLTASIYTAGLDISGNVLPGSEKTLYFYRNGSYYEGPFIHGLEFSPDGSKLYFTHDTSFYHPKPIEYYDFDNPNTLDTNGNGIYSLDIGSVNIVENDFQNSQIELALDGNLYFGAYERLGYLSNPNNPNPANFTDYAVDLPGYHANYGGDGLQTLNMLKAYTLPDQIDGMNYQNFAPTLYNETSYTATSSGVWQPGVGNNPWDIIGEVFIKDELIIPSGEDIIVENMTFRFAPEARVIIEQGAKLTLDNSTFTNANVSCDESEEDYWQGIQVYGTTDKNQYPIDNPTYQGLLVIQNGGVIEHAHKAVTNWKQNSWDEIGGVIQVTDGIFRNNRRDVEFMAYQNYTQNYSSKYKNFSF
ncbi:MAG: hypothetical protein WC967_15740, partial [Balneolaceae bacterium]